MPPEEIKAFIAQKVKEGLTEAQAKAAADAEVKRLADEKAQAEIDAKVQAGVKEALKSIKKEDLPNINFGEFATEKEVKIFDIHSGKMTGIRKIDEQESAFNNMLKALASGASGIPSAVAISKEIDQENEKISKQLGHKTPTPSRSDSDAVGGYAVPTEVDSRITQMIYANSVMYANANKNAVIFNSKVWPVMYGIEIADIADQGTAVTEKNPTFTNPSVSVARCGAFSAISNEFINQKGVDLVSAFIEAYGSAMARFLDVRLAIGNVTGTSDKVDGCVFDANTVLETAIARSALALGTLENMLESISDEADQGSMRWVCNRKVRGDIGGLPNSAGQLLFPQYLSGGELAPLGVPLLLNSKITSALDVGGDARTGGTDDALILIDFSKFYAVLDQATRIDLSKDFYFTTDLTTLRGIRRYGCKVMISNTVSTGGVCRAQELTN